MYVVIKEPVRERACCMSKRIQVLGIDIDNHTVRESMFLLEEYVNSDGLNLTGVVTADLLMQAADVPELRKLLEMMDLHIIGDVTVLEVLEESYDQQAGEIQRCDLEEVFLNSLIRKRKKIFWISDSDSDLPVLNNYMQENYPKLEIGGSFCGLVEEENLESVINEINSVAPDVIFIQTADWMRLGMLLQAKNQLNAKLRICMVYRVKSKFWSPNKFSKIKSLIDQTMFRRRAVKYEVNKE